MISAELAARLNAAMAAGGVQVPDTSSLWSGFNPQSGLSPQLLQYLQSNIQAGGGNVGASPDGRWQASFSRADNGGLGTFSIRDTLAPNNEWFDFSEQGGYLQNRDKSMDDNWGALLPLGAAALGIGLAGFGGAGGASSGLGGAGGFSGAAAGDAGLMYAGADAAAAGSLGMGGLGAGGTTAAMGAGSAGLGGLGSLGSTITSALGGGGSNLLGLGATALGALAGGQGQNASQSSTRSMDPRMDGLFYGDLAPRTQGVLGSTMPGAAAAGQQMLTKGSGLLGQTAPGTATNPYLSSIADDMQRRTQELLAENNLAIKGNAIGVGGLGGSRQGVAQGIAAGRAADSLQGQIANLYGGAYETDQNRLRQDWTIGSGLMNQGINTPFLPAQNTAQIYSPFTGYGTTTQSASSGGGLQGAIGGALGAAQLGKNMGWW